MNLPIFALLVRTVREDARRPLTYGLRAGVVAALGLELLLTLGLRGWQGAPGRDILFAIANVQLLAITVAGLTSFAAAISEEKQDGSLELLRLTDLGPLAILLGKGVSRFFGALLLILALLPLTLLAVTLGGVSVAQILSIEVVLVSYAFLLCNLALLCSVLAPRTGPAAALTAIVLGAIAAAVGLVPILATAIASPLLQTLADLLWEATPLPRLFGILWTGEPEPLDEWPLWSNLSTGMVCFLLAWLAFEHVLHLDQPAAPTGAAVRARSHRAVRRDRVWLDALAWKEHHFVHGGARARWSKLALLLAALLGFGAAMMANGFSRGNVLRWTQIAAAVTTLALTVDLALAAARTFRLEIDQRTLSALAMTPIDPSYLIRCKLVCATASAWPTGLALALILGLMAATMISDLWSSALSVPGLLGPIAMLLSLSLFIFGYFLPQALLLVKTVAWLSLRLRYGAPLLGIGLVALLNALGFATGFVTFGAGFISLPGAAIFVGAELRRSLTDSLDQLLAEE